jgi:hypothetical protein
MRWLAGRQETPPDRKRACKLQGVIEMSSTVCQSYVEKQGLQQEFRAPETVCSSRKREKVGKGKAANCKERRETNVEAAGKRMRIFC